MIRTAETFKRNIWCYFYAHKAYVNKGGFTEFDALAPELVL